MFKFDLSPNFEKDLKRIHVKNRALYIIFRRKMREIIENDLISIDRYKHLKSPLNDYQRIHLTGQYILLFKVNKSENRVTFMSIKHWDNAY